MSDNIVTKTPEQINAEARAARTSVVIGQETFDLYHMSEQTGARLYAALAGATDRKGNPVGAQYQQLANDMAVLAQSFQSIVSIPGPANLSASERIGAFIKEMQNGTGKVSASADQWLKEAWDSAGGKQIRDAFKSSSLDVASDAVDVVGTAWNNFTKPLMIPFKLGKFLEVLQSTGAEFANSVDGKVSEDAAKTFGAAWAAAVYMQVDAPNAPRSTQIPEADFWDKLGARWDWAMAQMPAVAAFLPFIGNFFTNGFQWSKAWDDAMAEAKASHAGSDATYEEILQSNLANKKAPEVRANAADMIEAAEEVAGLKTKPLSGAVRNGGIYRDHNGQWQELAFDKNKPTQPMTKPVVDDKGNLMTGGQDVANQWKALGQEILPSSGKAEALLPYGYAAYHMGKLGGGVASGTLGQMVGKHSVHQQAWDKLMEPVTKMREQLTKGTPVKNRLGVATGEYTPLTKKQAKDLAAQADDLERKIAKTPECKALEAKINSRKDLFGKTLTKFAEQEGDGAFKFGRRLASLPGKGSSGLLSLAENGKFVRNAGGLVTGLDGLQFGYALISGDGHGVAENGAELAGGYGGRKLASYGIYKLALKTRNVALPGRLRLIGAAAALGGQLLGRWGGDELVNAVMPGEENVPDYQREFVALHVQFQTQFNEIQRLGLRVNESHVQLINQLANQPDDVVIANLVQAGSIPQQLSDADKAKSLTLIKEALATQDRLAAICQAHPDVQVKAAADLAAEQEGSPIVNNTMKAAGTAFEIAVKNKAPYTASTSFLGKLVPSSVKGFLPKLTSWLPSFGGAAAKTAAVKTVSKFTPGPLGTAFMAVDDALEGVDAYKKGDTRAVAHNGGEIAGGVGSVVAATSLTTMVLSGMGVGAASGAPFFGIGAIPCAIIGGIAATGVYYFGSKAGGAVVDKVYDSWGGGSQLPQTSAPLAAAPKPAATSKAGNIEMDLGMQQALLLKQQTKQLFAMKSVSNVQMGALTADTGGVGGRDVSGVQLPV